MKKKFLFLIALLAISQSVISQMHLYVYVKDGTKIPYLAMNVDSVGLVNLPYEYVDMGLSVKWATCNVGSNRPEEYGDYFAWMETEIKSEYTQKNYLYPNDLPTLIPLKKDVANVKWGGLWRIPTEAEFYELLENCTWEFITLNNVNGCMFTSNINGNKLFFPAAGDKTVHVRNEGVRGYYFSSNTYEPYVYNNIRGLHFYSGGVGVSSSMTYWCGSSIRPVLP